MGGPLVHQAMQDPTDSLVRLCRPPVPLLQNGAVGAMLSYISGLPVKGRCICVLCRAPACHVYSHATSLHYSHTLTHTLE